MPGDYATHPLGAPGSPKAVKNGCLCPVLDNAHGKGIGDGAYWISEKCPIHNNAKDTMPIIPDSAHPMPKGRGLRSQFGQKGKRWSTTTTSTRM